MSREEPDYDKQAYADALQEIAGFSLHALLAKGHEQLLRTLVAKSMSGTATHQELAILRNVLRDNGLTMAPGDGAKTIEHRPLPALPHFDDPDEE